MISYVESGEDDDDEDEEIFVPAPRAGKSKGRLMKRLKASVSSEDDFMDQADSAEEEIDEGSTKIDVLSQIR